MLQLHNEMELLRICEMRDLIRGFLHTRRRPLLRGRSDGSILLTKLIIGLKLLVFGSTFTSELLPQFHYLHRDLDVLIPGFLNKISPVLKTIPMSNVKSPLGAKGGGFLGLTNDQWVGVGIGAGIGLAGIAGGAYLERGKYKPPAPTAPNTQPGFSRHRDLRPAVPETVSPWAPPSGTSSVRGFENTYQPGHSRFSSQRATHNPWTWQ